MLERLFGLDRLRGRTQAISTLDAWHPGLAPREYDFEALRREFMAPASPARVADKTKATSL